MNENKVSNVNYFINTLERGRIYNVHFHHAQNKIDDAPNRVIDGTDDSLFFLVYLGHHNKHFHFAWMGMYITIYDDDLLEAKKIG